MKINVTYPLPKGKSYTRRRLLKVLKWPFILSSIACVIVNICVGKPYWSCIVIVSLLALWKLVFSLDLVEYNRISQVIKSTLYVVILVTLINFLIVPIWTLGVLCIICFSALILAGVLFLTDIKRQKQNMLPMFFFIIVTMIASVIGFMNSDSSNLWTVIVMASLSFVLLLVCIFVLRADFIRELKKGFHIK
jgi:hypothetical protein